MAYERLCGMCGTVVPENETFCPHCGCIYIPSKTKAHSNTPEPPNIPKLKARIFKSSGDRRLKKSTWIWVQYIILLVLIFCSLRTVPLVWDFFTGGSLVTWGFMTICKAFLWLLIKVFWLTIPYLLPPILAYVFISTLSHNPLIRFLSGLGSVYLFYLFSGNISFSIIESAMNLAKLAFQIYFLLILITPDVLKHYVSAAASIIGSFIIYVLPSIPGALDEIAAVSVMTMMSVYINLLAIGVKQVTDSFLDRYIFKDEG